ncbi:predicted protein [Nematostella vectensis]|uniref:Centrosomin N-terminal motif 1 domain-containing protein n=1 Tax=Nematostella vectensis TaxID=45351 RepID=A7SU50_NEMVE|nr:predicted protein [Nematostella vectensis]|eukprot:XP_001624862.1 predicted protein [Nematostella vectensis]
MSSNPYRTDLEYRMRLRREYNFTPPPFGPDELDRQLRLRTPVRGERSRPTSFSRADVILRRNNALEERALANTSPRRYSHADVLERPEDEREAEDDFIMPRTSADQLENIRTPTGGMSFKDQETLIQELKKENFDLKLRLYMEQKERERLNDDFTQKVLVLETDLTEALDELSDALEREKDYDISINNARRREKSLMTKVRRLEETMREQDEEIKYLSRPNLNEIGQDVETCDVMIQTDRPSSSPYYEERGVDVDKGSSLSREIDRKKVDYRDPSPSPREHPDGVPDGKKQPPEGVDLLNHGAISRKDEILGEARRRRTLKKQKDKKRWKGSTMALDEMPEVDQTHHKQKKDKKSALSKFLCCCGSKSAREESYEYNTRTKR